MKFSYSDQQKIIFDGRSIADDKLVERDADNVPTAWRLFAVGVNALTKSGNPAALELSSDDMKAIADHFTRKGNRIPIDSRHFLFQLAAKTGRSESEILDLLPSKTGTMGFGSIEARADGLWLTDVEFVPAARELVKAGVCKYFSPVIRGIDGKSPLRVTSVALDNEPALAALHSLAASDDEEHSVDQSALSSAVLALSHTNPKQEKKQMTKVELALRKLLGKDALALSAETDEADASAILALADELPALREKARKTDELILAAESAKKEALINTALAEGKITNAQKDAYLKLSIDSAALSDVLAPIAKNSAVALSEIAKNPPADPNGGLSQEELAIAKRMNVTPEQFKASKAAQKGFAKA